MYDIIVIGGGPAGMTAALYALRAGKSVLVLEKHGFGGQITYSPKVENYPGTLQMSGNEFADRFLDQILNQGADVELEEATEIVDEGAVKRVLTADGAEFEAKAVIIATGVKHRMLGLPGENELVGSGISFCAVCDGDFFKGETVVVAGGGNSALQEAILLAETSREVVVVQDMDFLTGEKKLQDILYAKDNVRIVTGAGVTGLKSENGELCGVTVTLRADGSTEDIACKGLFVAIGLIPENDRFRSVAALNDWGYFAAGEDCLVGRDGVYCAGDCRQKSVRQVTTAVADGAVAALAACRYIDGM